MSKNNFDERLRKMEPKEDQFLFGSFRLALPQC